MNVFLRFYFWYRLASADDPSDSVWMPQKKRKKTSKQVRLSFTEGVMVQLIMHYGHFFVLNIMILTIT